MASGARYRFADLILDTGKRELTRGGHRVRLGRLTYALLVALVEAAPDVVTHDELVARVWGGRLTSPETVTQRVKLLRDALDDDAARPRYVGLVRGQGYRLLPEVQPVRPVPTEAGTASTPDSAPVRARLRRVAVPIAVLVTVLVAVGGVAVWQGRQHSRTDAGATFGPGESPSVAVLPFVNDSPDPEQQYFVDGLSGELINALNRIPGLAVAGRVSSFYFKGRNEDLRTIGDALRVQYVLSGSLQTSGDRLRIGAELVDVRTGRRVWGDTYERPRDDIFEIQDDITAHVARVLQIPLGVGILGRVPGSPSSVAAYEELVKGEGYLRELRADLFQPAIDHYLRATELDEESSMAWIGLAYAYATGAGNLPERAAEWRRLATEAADRARALTPTALHVLLWDAQLSVGRGDWSDAAAFYDRVDEVRFPYLAQEYGPTMNAWFLKGSFLLQVGRIREAIAHLEKARSLDPLNPLNTLLLGDAYADTGAYAAALAELDRGMRQGGLTAALQGYAVAVALATGDRAEIERRLAALWDSPATDRHRRMGQFLDDPAAGAAELRTYLAAEPGAPEIIPLLVLAHWAAFYGDPHAALELLRRIPRELAAPDIALALWRPLFRDVRRLAEFEAFVRELGLAAYWQGYGWPDLCEPDGDDFACR